MADLADHKARYALVVIGVLNAGIFFLTARGDSIATLPPAVTPWFVGFLGAYAFLTFIFVLHAIDCLRPRRLRYAELLPDARGLLGVLYWEAIASQPVEAYQKAWSEVRMGQINAELVLIMHRLSRLLQAKYSAREAVHGTRRSRGPGGRHAGLLCVIRVRDVMVPSGPRNLEGSWSLPPG